MISRSAIGSTRPSTWVMSVVLEAAGDEGDGVAVADVGQELVAQALALGGAAHQAGDVDEVDPRRDDLLRLGDPRQRVQPRLGHRHVADVGLDGAERIVGRLRRRGLGQRVEQGRLADVRQADDGDFEGHGTPESFREDAETGRCTPSRRRSSCLANVVSSPRQGLGGQVAPGAAFAAELRVGLGDAAVDLGEVVGGLLACGRCGPGRRRSGRAPPGRAGGRPPTGRRRRPRRSGRAPRAPGPGQRGGRAAALACSSTSLLDQRQRPRPRGRARSGRWRGRAAGRDRRRGCPARPRRRAARPRRGGRARRRRRPGACGCARWACRRSAALAWRYSRVGIERLARGLPIRLARGAAGQVRDHDGDQIDQRAERLGRTG